MRGMMEEHFAGLAVGRFRQRRSPNHAELTKRLFAAGFSAQLVRLVIDNMPEIEQAEAVDGNGFSKCSKTTCPSWTAKIDDEPRRRFPR